MFSEDVVGLVQPSSELSSTDGLSGSR